ncbi:hypothetical protein [Achromobacter ruhlandii]|uniref:hypothetical protein n=1 Tax=Achromobacter ruhlandii TaxID=72557 RepID=UPI000C266797|nr:hypothetical protein [Achromobacter ruhlandii]PJM72077.1 hypothetical protein CV751_03290 [Achromobacter ruhlandii]
MIKLADSNGTAIYVAPAAILSIHEAGTSSQWHGIRAYVRTFDHRTYEVQQPADEIRAAMAAAPQPCGICNYGQEPRS